MKTFFPLVILLFSVLTIKAQNNPYFHYDTIPASNRSVQTATMRQTVSTQETPVSTSKFDKSKLLFGGTFGFGWGSDTRSLNISPQIGYQFNQYVAAGLGIGYSYYRYDYYDYDWGKDKVTQNYLGFNIYGQVNPIRYIALRVQPEIYSMWGKNIPSKTVPCFLVGAGVTIPAGRVGGVSMMFYYDVAQNDYSPYGKEIFYSIGYVFGF